MSILQRTMVVSVCDKENQEVYNEVSVIPSFPISFELNAELSALSWEAFDKHLPLNVLWEKYNKIISSPKMDPLCTLFLVGFANASFCALFGGDWTARGIVFSATLIGFYVKQIMQKKHINHYIILWFRHLSLRWWLRRLLRLILLPRWPSLPVCCILYRVCHC